MTCPLDGTEVCMPPPGVVVGVRVYRVELSFIGPAGAHECPETPDYARTTRPATFAQAWHVLLPRNEPRFYGENRLARGDVRKQLLSFVNGVFGQKEGSAQYLMSGSRGG